MNRFRPHLPIRARHGFNVVIQHIGPCVEDDLGSNRFILEIRYEDFHTDARFQFADSPYCLTEVIHTTIRKIVAID
jgi:hypothetical protein